MKKKTWISIIAILAICTLVVGGIFFIQGQTKASEISLKEAEAFVNEAFDKLAKTGALTQIAEKNEIRVKELDYGDEKNVILNCELSTVDAHAAIAPHYNEFLSSDVKKANGTMYKSALDFKLEFEEKVIALVSQADVLTKNLTISLYEVEDQFVLFAEKSVVDAVFGGAVTISDEIGQIKTIKDSAGNEIALQSGNVNKGLMNNFSLDFDQKAPDTSTALLRTWNSIKADFVKNFLEYDRWKTIVNGLVTTIELTICALAIGIVLGFLVAFIRCTYIKNPGRGLSGFCLKVLNGISGFYLTITRGTPVVVQIMIIYFVIFMPIGVNKFLAAVVCFGLNSGAYVAEIVRGGIMSIDIGQTEAGRSLGFGYMATMWHIVFPQAFKAVLPSLANEFVVLLKETSIAFYIGLGDLMYAGNAIRAATYSPFMPLVAVALIYFIMVLILSRLVNILERRLRSSER